MKSQSSWELLVLCFSFYYYFFFIFFFLIFLRKILSCIPLLKSEYLFYFLKSMNFLRMHSPIIPSMHSIQRDNLKNKRFSKFNLKEILLVTSIISLSLGFHLIFPLFFFFFHILHLYIIHTIRLRPWESIKKGWWFLNALLFILRIL